MSTADATQQPDFDPTQGFITLGKGREAKQYLTVNWRVEWLRQEHPDASIVTEAISITDSAAVFKATVTLPSGAVGVGHGSQSAKQFPSFLEKAETKAIGRALAAIGYGTLSAFLEDADGDVIADTPVAQPQRQAQSRQQPEPTPIRPKALDWPDERLLGSLGGDAGDARVAVAARIYLDRATDKATLTARYTAARKAGLPKEVADELALARADQLGIPRAEPKPPPPPDDLTQVVGEPEQPKNARLVELVWSTARQVGWDEARVRQMGAQLYRSDDLTKWSNDQINSFLAFMRSGNHEQVAG